MKRSFLAAALLSAACAPAKGQDVRVRLYTNRPQEKLVITALESTLQWRACEKCPENATGQLIFPSGGLPASDVYIRGHYKIQPASGPVFSASYPLQIAQSGGRFVVNVAIPREDYVAAVLSAESGDFHNAESMKAMAVAVRTYSVRFRGQHEKDGFDFCDTTHCQVIGWKGSNAMVRSAVAATSDEILKYGAGAAATFYHQNCGGKVAASNEAWPAVREPYLVAHPDSFCTTAGGLHWESAIDAKEIDRALREASLNPPPQWQSVEVASRTESGRAQRIRLRGRSSPAFDLSASTFRFAVDHALGWNQIRSDLYEVHSANGKIVFTGQGAGHGVGLCQSGAEEMAREGKSYREILTFYYPGTQIEKITAGEWQKRSSERIDLLSTQPEEDSAVLPLAERILKEDESAAGWTLTIRVRLQTYATLDAYRNSTGQPGWVAAATRGHTIRLQPLRELKSRGILESTLRHELFHLLIESRVRAATPLWFREGLVLYFANPEQAAAAVPMSDSEMETILTKSKNREEVEKVYASAKGRVAALMQQFGKETVIGWLGSGIPGSVAGRLSGSGQPRNE